MVEIDGIKIYGSSWVLPRHEWAFNLKEDIMKEVWERLPSDIDILVTHGPPKGHRATTHKNEDIGDIHLANAVKRIKPAVHVFGHVHTGYGKSRTENTWYLNAVSVNSKYHPVNSPIVFDIVNMNIEKQQ
eukprot:TRINITY_DN4939_c0_g1_i3.p1 TRINITY_DN4939_c0_g1~~TRINITY_DN4939_c0_g1_i3.p1  ORF type:complete len:130 (-),score=23.47 TRINITY_DN4939_c0_g1_i3:20-409(-)